MNLESTLVLCDLDALMLGPDGNLTQVLRDVLQLFTARGGRMTVFSQKTPKAVASPWAALRRWGTAFWQNCPRPPASASPCR